MLVQPFEQSPNQRSLSGAGLTREKNDSFARPNPILNRFPRLLNPGRHKQITWIGADREGILSKAEEAKETGVRVSLQVASIVRTTGNAPTVNTRLF